LRRTASVAAGHPERAPSNCNPHEKGRSTLATRPAKTFTLARIESVKIPTKKRPDGQAKVALTPMERAFLGALTALAQRGDASITPAGDVAPDELRATVVALCAKGERGAE
jgi:hypothetical protein